jgi:hypothetical protein
MVGLGGGAVGGWQRDGEVVAAPGATVDASGVYAREEEKEREEEMLAVSGERKGRGGRSSPTWEVTLVRGKQPAGWGDRRRRHEEPRVSSD